MNTAEVPTTTGIYKWTNLVTGQVLVGQAGSSGGFRKRYMNYVCDLRKGKYGNTHFQRSFAKHGEYNFSFEILEVIPAADLAADQHKALLTAREQFWVDHYRFLAGGVYNQVGPVDSPSRGAKLGPLSEEHKAKISAANKGKRKGLPAPPMTEEHKENIRKARAKQVIQPHVIEAMAAANRGKSRSEEVKAKISAKNKGKTSWRKGIPMSDDTKTKIGAANRGRPNPNKGKKRDPAIGAKISATKMKNKDKGAQQEAA